MELAALHHQMTVLRRQISGRPKLNLWDRLFFATLYRIHPRVLRTISIVQPDTVVRWHRSGFPVLLAMEVSREDRATACVKGRD